MTPQERLHEFLVSGMKAEGHAPAVFFGQDQRRLEHQSAPGIVYAYDDAAVVDTTDGEVVLDEVFSVQVGCRGDGAEEVRSGMVRRLLERGAKSDEISIVLDEADRDDDIDLTYHLLSISVSARDSDEPIAPLRETITYGTPPTAVTVKGIRIEY